MKRFIRCSSCGWIEKGRNQRFIMHQLRCKPIATGHRNLVIVTLTLFLLGHGTLNSNATIPAVNYAGAPGFNGSSVELSGLLNEWESTAIEAFLKGHQVEESRRPRIVQAILDSSRRHDLESRLIASIVVVESRGNPFAISGSNAVGIMQVHVPTWGQTIDEEGIDLFNIEDNIDFGTRILKGYVERYGRDKGVMRYMGWKAGDPESLQNAEGYLKKVLKVYVS